MATRNSMRGVKATAAAKKDLESKEKEKEKEVVEVKVGAVEETAVETPEQQSDDAPTHSEETVEEPVEGADSLEQEANYTHVQPTRAAMHDPHQMIRIPEGTWTLVEKTNWIDVQVEAGFLKIKEE